MARTELRPARALALAVLVSLTAGWMAPALADATIVITNGNKGKKGFNDPTLTAPVGGNTGTTLGAQRLIAFNNAAEIWGATLSSTVTINILASFEALDCDATSAVLGSAGATKVFKDFSGAAVANTWYPYALANKRSGVDQTAPRKPQPQIVARFNSKLGQADCLAGSPFYLGVDGITPAGQVNLVAVLLHEFGHGLGFQTFTSGAPGAQLQGSPSIWDHSMRDNSTGKVWAAMTDAERAASALNSRKLVWTGANVFAALPAVLSLGTPQLQISGGAAAGVYQVGPASFGPPLAAPALTGALATIVPQAGSLGAACEALDAANAAAVAGKIALLDRGGSTFTLKAASVQAAGAIAMIVIDNVVGTPPDGLGGDNDGSITIPSVRISLEDGTAIRAQLGGVTAALGVNPLQYAGADAGGFALLYTPNPFQPGSSISHWDTIATRNLLMEPSSNDDLTFSVRSPNDLTYELLLDIGW